eukprot:gene693-1150_t
MERESFRKNREPDYPLDTYPPFAIGCSGYAMNRVMVQYFYDNASLRYYANEDAGFGIWLSEAPFANQVRFINDRRMECDGVCRKNSITVGHDMNEIAMRVCHAKHTV